MSAIPNRRPSLVREVWWNNKRHHVAVGVHPETGDACEVFAQGPKSGSDSWATLQDACVFISRRRRTGETFKSMRSGVLHGARGEPLSVMGAVLEVAAEVESELDKLK